MQCFHSMMNFCLDGNGVFQDDNVPFHPVIWKAWQRCYRISSTSRNNVRWIVGDSEKGIRDDGVPTWSPAIILSVVATSGVALEEINGPSAYHETQKIMLWISFLTALSISPSLVQLTEHRLKTITFWLIELKMCWISNSVSSDSENQWTL